MTRLRAQDGFTLPELLTAMTMSMVILLAAFGLLDTAMKRTTETQLRVEATQRGRQALDILTRQLRSQVCLNATTPALVQATPNSVTFYADLTNGNGGPETRVEKRVLTYVPPPKITESGKIMESVYRPGGTSSAITYPPEPTTTREVLGNVREEPDKPIFSYFAFKRGTTATDAPTLDKELDSPTTSVDLGSISRIDLNFAVAPGAGGIAASSVVLRDAVYVRSANPNDSDPRPTCA
jgi:type II secretory pathway pseudopilin PulG